MIGITRSAATKAIYKRPTSGARITDSPYLANRMTYRARFSAWRLGFQPQLGPSWFAIADVPVYVPVAFFWWWYHYDAYAPGIFIEGAAIASSGGFASIGIAIGMSVWRAREAKTITTYGSARWATKAEVCGAGRRPLSGAPQRREHDRVSRQKIATPIS